MYIGVFLRDLSSKHNYVPRTVVLTEPGFLFTSARLLRFSCSLRCSEMQERNGKNAIGKYPFPNLPFLFVSENFSLDLGLRGDI